MATPLLTTAATLSCPHGASVAIVSTNTRSSALAPLALATDTFTVIGCRFQLPTPGGPVPHPCVSVRWVKPNTKCLVAGQPTLAADSAGLCLAADQVPQGPVVIAPAQTRALGA